MQTSIKYEGCRDYLVKFANQEAALRTVEPKASINQVGGEEETEIDALGNEKGSKGPIKGIEEIYQQKNTTNINV